MEPNSESRRGARAISDQRSLRQDRTIFGQAESAAEIMEGAVLMPRSANTIKHAEAFLVDIPVETERTDAIQAFLKQETIFVRIRTANGEGLGYSYTIGTGGTAVLALLKTDLLPRLIGQDGSRPEAVWRDRFMWTHATSVGAITSLALAAVDLALWDLRSRQAALPLWRMLGGAQDRVALYDTEGGWLHLEPAELADSAAQVIDQGWRGMKMKVGKDTVAQDEARVAATREALGDEVALLVDANQGFTVAEARSRCDMLAGFAEYIGRRACDYVQVDVARIGGITPWMKVAHLAEAFGLKVAPHFLMEIHVSLACAVPNACFVEHIPQLHAVTTDKIVIDDGFALAPEQPGLGISWDHDALDRLTVR